MPGMADTIKPNELAGKTGISLPYASQLLSGKRTPSPTLAIAIFRKTGLKFGPIAQASEEDIEAMARVYGEAA